MSLPIPEELVGTTQALFYEYRHQTTTGIQAPYTLKERDWKGSKSMYKIYMEHETEYEAAIALLGSWQHWKKLSKVAWFQAYKQAWDEEREIRQKAVARNTLLKQAKEGNVTAAKALIDGEKKPRGRPKTNEKPKKDNEALVRTLTARIDNLG